MAEAPAEERPERAATYSKKHLRQLEQSALARRLREEGPAPLRAVFEGFAGEEQPSGSVMDPNAPGRRTVFPGSQLAGILADIPMPEKAMLLKAAPLAAIPLARREAIEQVSGRLVSPREGWLSEQLRNVPSTVKARVEETQRALKQPIEPWQPREYAFERGPIKEALEGFPGQTQTRFQRYEPKSKDLSFIDEIYTDPVNRNLIKQQIARGLSQGGETFYASLWPVYQEAMSRGIPRQVVDQWVHRVTTGSIRNSIYNEQAVGNLLHGMAQRDIPLTARNVAKEQREFKREFGARLPLMPVHTQGVRRQVEGLDPRTRMEQPQILLKQAFDYKVPTYSMQRSGDFGKSWVGDVHEARGETLGSRLHPYFAFKGRFEPEEYGRAEGHMLDIAGEMGLPGGMAQAGRWFGGGELTGLQSPRGDALDMLEKQVAYTMQLRGVPVTPHGVRDYTMKLITQGGYLAPWALKTRELPDVR